MSRYLVLRLAWPVVGLSGLLTAACLASIAYIGRQQSDLGHSMRADFDRLQAAQQAQIHLREFRVHTLVLAAEPTEARRRQVERDRERIRAAFDALRSAIDSAADRADLAELEAGWARYQAAVDRVGSERPPVRSAADLATWSDAHHMAGLLVPSTRIVDRAEATMARTSGQSQTQTTWAGRGLLALGIVGPLAGLVGGFALARGVSRRVARLSLHVRAVQAQLSQDVGAVTIERSSPGDLDAELEAVVDRVQQMCRRVQEQERELLRAEQLAAVGHLAAGVAHEVRNPLTGIKMLVEAAARRDAPTPLTQHDLDLITDEIGRLERTVQGLLDYARVGPPARQPHDVRRAVARACAIVSPRAERAGVTIDAEVGPDPLVARIDPDQFASLLSNLLINALDATPDGGRVRVEAGRTPDRRVRVAVRDSGAGIPAEVAETLFTPFATTKPRGTGLGLAVARQVAIDHGGTLTAANPPGGGACFTVTLPCVEDARA